MKKPNLENLIIPSGILAVDPKFGIDVLSQYLFELHQVSCGIPYKALGISDRRKASNVMVTEVSRSSGSTKDSIAIVNLSGLIQAEGGMSSVGTAQMAEQLLKEKPNVIGALFKINSGGGYLDGGEIMSAAAKEFGKPTVTLANYAGSAAYMIASQTDQILALSRYSSFGSIGVFFELDKGFRDMYKEFVDTAYSETSPDKNAEWRQYLEGDLSGFVKLATKRDSVFMKDVSKNRRLTNYPRHAETLRGGMFDSEESMTRGLIDGYGDNQKAYSIIQKLSK